MNLRVFEIFPSFQGEGRDTGLPTTFIRLSGCNLRCTWCDTEYALDPSSGEDMTAEGVMEVVREVGFTNVCITGGEPLLQRSLIPLLSLLAAEDYDVSIETNGSVDIEPFRKVSTRISFSIDLKLPASGEYGSLLVRNLSILGQGDQIKFVVRDRQDLLAAVKYLEDLKPSTSFIFTPVDNKGGEELAKGLMEWLEDISEERRRELGSRLRLMVQTHKVIWDPKRRGV
ncbi:MAG: 7-carboxy-7-deazaguanine synthase QueE [Thermoplasmatota archaeon]